GRRGCGRGWRGGARPALPAAGPALRRRAPPGGRAARPRSAGWAPLSPRSAGRRDAAGWPAGYLESSTAPAPRRRALAIAPLLFNARPLDFYSSEACGIML